MNPASAMWPNPREAPDLNFRYPVHNNVTPPDDIGEFSYFCAIYTSGNIFFTCYRCNYMYKIVNHFLCRKAFSGIKSINAVDIAR